MPELSYAFLASFVRTEGGLAHIIGAGVDTIWAPQVPAGQNLALVARLAFTRQECGRPHRLEVIFMDEDGERILAIQNVVVPTRAEGLPAHWPQGWIAGMNFGVPLPRYGNYAFEVLINDENRATLHLRVVAPPAAPEQQQVDDDAVNE